MLPVDKCLPIKFQLIKSLSFFCFVTDSMSLPKSNCDSLSQPNWKQHQQPNKIFKLNLKNVINLLSFSSFQDLSPKVTGVGRSLCSIGQTLLINSKFNKKFPRLISNQQNSSYKAILTGYWHFKRSSLDSGFQVPQ